MVCRIGWNGMDKKVTMQLSSLGYHENLVENSREANVAGMCERKKKTSSWKMEDNGRERTTRRQTSICIRYWKSVEKNREEDT